MVEINERAAAKLLSVIDAGLTIGLGDPRPGEMCAMAAVCYALGEPHGDKSECVAAVGQAVQVQLNDTPLWQSAQFRATGLRRLGIALLGTAGTLDETEFVRRVAMLVVNRIVPQALRSAAGRHPDTEHRANLIAAAEACERAAGLTAAAAAAARSAEGLVEGSVAWSAAELARSAAELARSVGLARSAEASAEASAGSAVESAGSVAELAWASAGLTRSERLARSVAEGKRVLCDFAEQVVQILIEMESPGSKFLYLTEAGTGGVV